MLIIDATGEIVAKTYNVVVHDNGGPALNIGDHITLGHTITIEPIIYDELPAALFEANHIDDHDSHIDGTHGVFYMQETWNSVTIINGSDSPILLEGTGGSPSVSINTLNASMNTTPEAVISISVDKGAETSPSVFQFDVKHIFPATDVLIQSARGPPTSR